jgi:ribonuclease HI
LDQAAERHKVIWEWTRGHNGHVVQEAVDKAARKIASLGHVDEETLSAAVDKVGDIDPLVIEAESN